MRSCGSSATACARSRSSAATASLAHDRPAQEHEAHHEDERDRAEEHAKPGCAAPLGRVAEGTEGEVEGDGAGGEHKESDGEDAQGHAHEFGVHLGSLSLAQRGAAPARAPGAPLRTSNEMRAALFDFDETMIDLEREHDFAHRALCRDLGSDYDALPESFRFGSGRRIVDDIREMREFFGWTVPEGELYAMRHRHFLEAL